MTKAERRTPRDFKVRLVTLIANNLNNSQMEQYHDDAIHVREVIEGPSREVQILTILTELLTKLPITKFEDAVLRMNAIDAIKEIMGEKK